MSKTPEKPKPVSFVWGEIALMLVVFIVGFGTGYSAKPSQAPTPMSASVQAPRPDWKWMKVKFSPRGGATDQIVKAIRQAQREVLVMAFSFTSEPIANALAEAKGRGLDVMLILDEGANKLGSKTSKAGFVASKGCRVWLDGKHAIMHNKVIILDGEAVLTGSFNFTKSAEESNAENSVPVLETAKVDAYVDNWKKHVWHCEAFPNE